MVHYFKKNAKRTIKNVISYSRDIVFISRFFCRFSWATPHEKCQVELKINSIQTDTKYVMYYDVIELFM
jgi:hypothetical protein